MENFNNVEIYRKKLDNPIIINSDNINIIFDDYHKQDCCETVYADWDVFKTTIKDIENLGLITEISISATTDMGFTIFFYNGKEKFGEPERIGVFVPCYNEQNGYYSDELELIINLNGQEEKIDISDYVLDNID